MNFTEEEIREGRGWAVIAYIGILALVPAIFAGDNRFIRFHANNGIAILIAEVLFFVVYNILSYVLLLNTYSAGNILIAVGVLFILVSIILSIWGIVMASKGEAKAIPCISRCRLVKVQ